MRLGSFQDHSLLKECFCLVKAPQIPQGKQVLLSNNWEITHKNWIGAVAEYLWQPMAYTVEYKFLSLKKSLRMQSRGWDWRNNSTVKGTGCSCKEQAFVLVALCNWLSVTTVPGNQMTFFSLDWHSTYMYTGKHYIKNNLHIFKILFFKKEKNQNQLFCHEKPYSNGSSK